MGNSLLPVKRDETKTAGLIFIAAIALLLAGCAPSKEELRTRVFGHPTLAIAYWGKGWQARPLHERVAPAPDELIEKLVIENRLYDFPERPVAATPTPEFSSALRQVEKILPERVLRLAGERIIGLYLVDDLGGSGYTEAIRDEAGKERYAILVLDRKLLRAKKANAWATWRERSFFKSLPGNPPELHLVIEEGPKDSAENAIVQILLHEIGHALGMAAGTLPSWNGNGTLAPGHPFADLSWRARGGSVESLWEEAFPERKSLKIYAFADAPLTAGQARESYAHLARTGFPTLYAAVSPWEDFAESFANYLHVVREGKPYTVLIRKAGREDEVFSACWNQERCAAKRAFLERWMADPLR
jgi:hypothetical protein